MGRLSRRNALRALCIALTVVLTPASSFAIDGGGLAGRNRLSEATVGIGTLVTGSGAVSLSRCSGVLIAPSLVLTAAHCVSGDPVASAVVFYDGAEPVRRPIPVASLARYAVPANLPPQYASFIQLSLDTAVLRLASPVRGRAPIPISHGAQPPQGLRLAGAGLSHEGVGVLKVTHLDPVFVSSTGLIVAQTRGSTVCKGDSGGPVVADGPRGPMLWGVASAIVTSGAPCGRVVIIAPAAPNL